ncbi:VCBS repeat-containing protein [Urechidicola vernalis]|uniref:VCBS repeat-containing protein n=1 Tax=Urechidicola vernalis TaxID=3075600 RepID=A0ABU2Y7F9_9FLAO|nr:VCBS repeat-containing protein [Urechidicola sp. P050]MDT0553574.1 VCBS repeat-containing protein [Urechidicola sp. P050]
MKKITLFTFISCIAFACSLDTDYKVLKTVVKDENKNLKQFSVMSDTGINFENFIEETRDMNFLNFANIYNGGGVAAADFNNDGLTDLYFTANQKKNSLYLNKGDFSFEDVTKNAGVDDKEGWTTGVSVVDINNDGWLDIYVCKSGVEFGSESMVNKLFINQKDNSFKEMAETWKLNDPGFSTQSYFFDFDKDGDLDMYLVNHRPDFNNAGGLNLENDAKVSQLSSDKLYRNEGTFFSEITHEAGVVNKAWGLSASIGDFNNDGWPDVYVCNDFISPDMLYINNQNGTFTNEILDVMNHVSFSSMGSDYADIDNDLLPDLLVLEMAAEDHERSKKNMATMSTSSFNYMVKSGYHHQYMINTLQKNQGNGKFSEISQLSGLAKTDWSWAPLIADFDNDGYKDVFITNGILKEMGDQDFRTNMVEKFNQPIKPTFQEVTEMLSSTKLSNYGFKNNGDLSFTNKTKDWGLDIKSNSNGVAYADLDNDGDLDLIVNNINEKAQVYKNNDAKNFIQFKLSGDDKNSLAIGTNISISTGAQKQMQELYMTRGFISSVQNVLNFGVGSNDIIEEAIINWPNGSTTILNDLASNQIISLEMPATAKAVSNEKEIERMFFEPSQSTKLGVSYRHTESNFDDFQKQILLPHSQSTNGPFIAQADVNNDGFEDFYVGGAAGQTGELYIQLENATFKKKQSKAWINDKDYEDLGVLFFDADGDNDQDIYVVSGSSEFEEYSNMFQDRLYINNGDGSFNKSVNMLPNINSSGQTVVSSDVDNDGDLDLFVGGRVIPDKYPFAPESQLLINENGKFINKTKSLAAEMRNIGMVTDAVFTDYDNDGDDDLMVVGEWMPISIFENNSGKFSLIENSFLTNTTGLWFSIAANDIDNDGDSDYIIGNLGLNAKYKVNAKKEFHIFCDDFDNNGTYDIVLSSNYNGKLVPSRGKECSTQQMPFVSDKFPSYQAFAQASLVDVYGEKNLDNALHYQADILESILLENIGDGKFKIKKLPIAAQFAPIMGIEFLDLDNDSDAEIILVGNHYNTEVETVRYDASFGTVLKYDHGEFSVVKHDKSGFFNKGNAKDIIVLQSENGHSILVSNNNESLSVFKLN